MEDKVKGTVFVELEKFYTYKEDNDSQSECASTLCDLFQNY